MSDFVWPHRRQPTRLPRPWDSPGKNTGVGCHFLFQCLKVKSESEVAQSCPPLSDPMDNSLPGSSMHRIFQARVWSGVPLPSSASQLSEAKSYFLIVLILHSSVTISGGGCGRWLPPALSHILPTPAPQHLPGRKWLMAAGWLVLFHLYLEGWNPSWLWHDLFTGITKKISFHRNSPFHSII